MPKIAEIEPTPNPNAMKFILKEPLTWGISRSYENAEQAKDDDKEPSPKAPAEPKKDAGAAPK